MDTLPRDVQLEIVKSMGLDGLRALGVRPGRLRVPQALAAALASSLSLLSSNILVKYSYVLMRIADTDRAYMLSRWDNDAAWGIEQTVELHLLCWNGMLYPQKLYQMYRGKRTPRHTPFYGRYATTTRVDLDAPNAVANNN